MAGVGSLFRQWYLEMPPVTRAYSTACFMTTLAVQLDIVSPFQLYYNPMLIWKQYQAGFIDLGLLASRPKSALAYTRGMALADLLDHNEKPQVDAAYCIL